MADNTLQTAADNIATDELATLNGVDVSGQSPRIKAQRVKVGYGPDGTFTDVDTPTPLPSLITSVPAANATTDSIAAALQTGAIMSGLTVLTPKFATIVASASGVTIVVAAVTSKKIRVVSWELSASGIVNVKWQSHTTPTDLTGLHYMNATGTTGTGTAGAPFSPAGHFESLSGQSLDINLSAAIPVGGSLVYVEV